MRSLLSRHFKHVHRVEAVTKAVAKSGRSLANTLGEEQSLRILRSHVRAVRTAYDAGDPFVVVMEDDVSMDFSPFWQHSTLDAFILTLPQGWLAVQLGYTAIKGTEEGGSYPDYFTTSGVASGSSTM
jgi:hypothetical protein